MKKITAVNLIEQHVKPCYFAVNNNLSIFVKILLWYEIYITFSVRSGFNIFTKA